MNLYQTIKEIAKSKKTSIYKLEKDLSFTNGTLIKWEQSMPRADNLQKVANYLGVTSEYLLNKIKKV